MALAKVRVTTKSGNYRTVDVSRRAQNASKGCFRA
eukprot:CAMPEP_0171607330 /NCGR_PEP_ID=MMETSP0990-20121206/8274_1 /TAXON_ID=483369 /ORGANISM="non described non described, Strain CCMP2098" /LENGTH=34 /DNA_ID= /DNA_START= /DNA_END= /DNA_ORIENTATION=